MSVWEWITTTLPAGAVLSGAGVTVFTLAILTDKLMTQAQHLRRVADLTENHNREVEKLNEHHSRELAGLMEHHARELAEKDARMADLRESREGYKEAMAVERARADTAMESVKDISETMESMLHVVRSLDLALPSGRGE